MRPLDQHRAARRPCGRYGFRTHPRTCLQFRWRRIDRWFPKDSAEKYSVLENCEDSTRATIMALDHKRASRLSPPLKDGHWRGAGEGKVTPRSKIPEVQNECVGETSHGFDYACSVNGVRSRSGKENQTLGAATRSGEVGRRSVRQ